MPRMASLRQRLTGLIPELAKFGVVGLIGTVIDLGGADYLHNHLGVVPTHVPSVGDLTFEVGFVITAAVYLTWHAIARTGRETTLAG